MTKEHKIGSAHGGEPPIETPRVLDEEPLPSSGVNQYILVLAAEEPAEHHHRVDQINSQLAILTLICDRAKRMRGPWDKTMLQNPDNTPTILADMLINRFDAFTLIATRMKSEEEYTTFVHSFSAADANDDLGKRQIAIIQDSRTPVQSPINKHYIHLGQQTQIDHDGTQREVTIQEQLDSIEEKIEDVIHDLAQPMTAARGSLQMAERSAQKGTPIPPSYIEKLNTALSRIHSYLEGDVPLILLEQYNQNLYWIPKFVDDLQNRTASIAEDLRLEFGRITMDPRLMNKFTIWDKVYAYPWFMNLLTNAARQYEVRDTDPDFQDRAGLPRTITMHVVSLTRHEIEQYGLDPNIQYMAIDTTDCATRFLSKDANHDFEKDGFKRNVTYHGNSRVQGKGTGGSAGQKMIRQYGGIVKIINRTDTPGAIVRTILPVYSTAQMEGNDGKL